MYTELGIPNITCYWRKKVPKVGKVKSAEYAATYFQSKISVK